MNNNDYTTEITKLLTTIPAILGYRPTARMVAVHLDRDNTVRNLAAIDLHNPRAAFESLPHSIGVNATNTASAILVGVAEHPVHNAVRDLLNITRDAYLDADVPVIACILTESLDADSPWIDIDTIVTGKVEDPSASEYAAGAVLEGRPLLTDRDEIEAEFNEQEPAVLPGGTVDYTILDALAAVIDGAELTTELIAAIAAGITDDVHTRDALLYVSLKQLRPAAVVWTRIAAHLRAAARMEALSIAAALYYCARDGVRAGEALTIADTISTRYDIAFSRFGMLLSASLHSGVAPQEVLKVLTAAATRATGQL